MRGTPGSSSRCRRRRPASASSAARRWRARSVRSASATVRCARCSTRRIVTPRSRISVSAAKTASTTVGASPSDGSSSRSTSGAATSARPIASCCCWPPESAPGLAGAEVGEHRKEVVGGGERIGGAAVAPAGREPEPQVLLHGELAEDAPAFRDERDPGAGDRLRRAPADRPAGEAGRLRSAAGTTPMIACSVVDLPAPFGPDQADELASLHLEVEPAHRRHRAVADVEAVQLEHRARRHSATALSPR